MITKKPWGVEEIIYKGKYVLKKIIMEKGHKCSFQYHKKKHETIYVLCGKLSLVADGENITMSPGTHAIIPAGVFHRMEGLETTEYLEASTPELKDVVRLEDDYNRV